jgi:hypothetical protein
MRVMVEGEVRRRMDDVRSSRVRVKIGQNVHRSRISSQVVSQAHDCDIRMLTVDPALVNA